MESLHSTRLMEVYTRVYLYFGDPRWWPGDNPFEVAVGAILTQNTSWTNVERSIKNLKERDMLDPATISKADPGNIATAIRPAGYFNQKAGYLIALSKFIMDELNGEIDLLSTMDIEIARNRLLTLKGIGKETADSILCYSADLPIFVVDAYTKRILQRIYPEDHSLFRDMKGSEYDHVQGSVMTASRGDHMFYNRFHALMVILGSEKCRPKPLCGECPLKDMCRTGLELAVVTRKKEK